MILEDEHLSGEFCNDAGGYILLRGQGDALGLGRGEGLLRYALWDPFTPRFLR